MCSRKELAATRAKLEAKLERLAGICTDASCSDFPRVLRRVDAVIVPIQALYDRIVAEGIKPVERELLRKMGG